MKPNSGDHTHNTYATPPERFRAQATGVGNTQRKSELTGRMRAQCVADCMTPKTRAQVPANEGYPAPTGDGLMAGGCGTLTGSGY